MENNDKRLYEGMFIMPQTFVREDEAAAFEVLKGVFEKFEAEVKHMGVWSERSLAFEINHVREATYVLTYFEAQPESIAKLERTFHITDNVLRTLIVKPEKGFDLDVYKKELEARAAEEAVAEAEEKEEKASSAEESEVKA